MCIDIHRCKHIYVAIYIFKILDKKFKDVYQTGLKLNSIKLWETPSSYAECIREDIE